MAESTALEALTAVLLGDVGLLHDQIKELPGALAPVLQQATDEIQIAATEIERQTGANIAAANQLDEKISDIRKKTAQFIEEKAAAATENAKNNIKAAALETFREAFKEALAENNALVSQIMDEQKKASNRLIVALNDAEMRVQHIRVKSWWDFALYTLIGGLLGGIVVAVSIKFGFLR